MNEAEIRQIHWEDQIGQSRLSAAVEAEEMNLFAMLKPRLFQDGNQWCVLHGDDPQSGICGFGDTPRKAIWAFNKAWDYVVPNVKLTGCANSEGMNEQKQVNVNEAASAPDGYVSIPIPATYDMVDGSILNGYVVRLYYPRIEETHLAMESLGKVTK